MARFERQITINAPMERTFAYLVDLPRHAEWAGHRIRIEQTSQEPPGVGSTYSSGHQGKEPKDQVRITELVPNQKIAFEAQGPDGHFLHFFLLDQDGDRTRLTKGIELLRLSLMMKLMSPLLLIMGPRILAGDLKRIKAKLEA